MQALIWTAAGIAAAAAHAAEPAKVPALEPRPALVVAHATQAAVLGVARAGRRIVAVGDHGVVLLSDDDGKRWRQARAVPVRSTLTAVSFADDRNGWAAGHWGVVLHTADGGDTWSVQRLETAEDRPIFSIHAFDAQHLAAVGLWSLALTSADGGRSWQSANIEAEIDATAKKPKSDHNLFQLFTDARGTLFAAGERGVVLRSDDRGRAWRAMQSGYKGSFWTGVSPRPGVLIAAGLRGSVWRSNDNGATWARLPTPATASITALAAQGERITAVGLDGLVLESTDGGASFSTRTRADRAALTAVLLRDGQPTLYFSRQGPAKE